MRAPRIFVDGAAGISAGQRAGESETFHLLVEGLQRETYAIMAVEASALNGGHATALPEESMPIPSPSRMEDQSRATVRSIERQVARP